MARPPTPARWPAPTPSTGVRSAGHASGSAPSAGGHQVDHPPTERKAGAQIDAVGPPRSLEVLDPVPGQVIDVETGPAVGADDERGGRLDGIDADGDVTGGGHRLGLGGGGNR